MRYDEAVKVWGAHRLATARAAGWTRRTCKEPAIDPATVIVRFDFDEGFACCGGSDPDCYCSFAQSPSAEVFIEGLCRVCDTTHAHGIDVQDFNFVDVLKEIVDVGNGVITE